MALNNFKSTSITNLDATPSVANSIGEGAPGQPRVSNDQLAAVTADNIGSTYRLCRFPTNAKVKQVILTSAIATGGSGDIDVAFSDNPNGDGTQASLLGGVVQLTGPVDNKLFGAGQSLVALTTRTDFTFKGTFLPAHQNIPLWQVLVNLGATQFTADPGGFFDLLIKLTVAVTTGGVVSGEVWYVE